MNVIFRTDASTNIGTGHVMRCLTLADELKQRNANIRFICREETGNLIELIEKKGFKVYRLPANIDMEEDKVLTGRILKKQSTPPDWLIIDHYKVDLTWESFLRMLIGRIMVIDDLFDRKHDCDILLDQNYSLNEERYNGLLPDHCIQLLGPKYALLRTEFRKERESLLRCKGKVKRILVFMGGADASNETCKVLRGIRMLDCSDVSIDVVIGASNIHVGEVEAIVTHTSNATCHKNVENMAELMVSSDLCIGTSGITTWERCSVGLPSLVVIAANNQRNIAENLSKIGVAINLGWFEDVKDKDIASALEGLLNEPDTIRQMSLKSLEVVDALSTERVARELMYVKSQYKKHGHIS